MFGRVIKGTVGDISSKLPITESRQTKVKLHERLRSDIFSIIFP